MNKSKQETKPLPAPGSASTLLKPAILAVAAVTLLGLAIRLWGIRWGLPDARHPLASFHPDEIINLNAALTADIPHGQFDIKFYNYGAFYFYLVSFAVTFARGWGLIPATAQTASPQLAQLAAENAALFLTGRIVTALMGAATVPALYVLGSRCFGRKAGLLAALFYAIAPLAVVLSHYLTVDAPATLFVTLALYWSVRMADSTSPDGVESQEAREKQNAAKGSWREWKPALLAAVFVGLAAATKYNAGMVVIAPVMALFVNRQAGVTAANRVLKLICLLAFTGIVFLIACPGPWLNWDVFWNGTYPGSGAHYELFEHTRTGHGELFLNTGNGWWYHLVSSLNYGMGIPLLLLSLGGLAYAFRRRTASDRVLISFFLLSYFIGGLSTVRFARYMLPLFPVLCLFAARFATAAFASKTVQRAALGFGAFTALFTAGIGLSLSHTMSLQDARDAAADYLQKNAPQGASVAFPKIPWFSSPPLSPLFGSPRPDIRASAGSQETRFQLRIPAHEWDASVLTPPPDYVVLPERDTLYSVDRLHQPDAVRFVQSIPPTYGRRTFGLPAPVFGLPRGFSVYPEDLLHVTQTVTIYER